MAATDEHLAPNPGVTKLLASFVQRGTVGSSTRWARRSGDPPPGTQRSHTSLAWKPTRHWEVCSKLCYHPKSLACTALEESKSMTDKH